MLFTVLCDATFGKGSVAALSRESRPLLVYFCTLCFVRVAVVLSYIVCFVLWCVQGRAVVIGSPQELKSRLGQHYSLQVVLSHQATSAAVGNTHLPHALGLHTGDVGKLPIGTALGLQEGGTAANSSWQADSIGSGLDAAVTLPFEKKLLVAAEGIFGSGTDPRVTRLLSALQVHFPGAALREAHMGTASFSLPAKGLSLAAAFTVGAWDVALSLVHVHMPVHFHTVSWHVQGGCVACQLSFVRWRASLILSCLSCILKHRLHLSHTRLPNLPTTLNQGNCVRNVHGCINEVMRGSA